jgi:hypothetical protein
MFSGLHAGKVAEMVDGICKNPQNFAKSVIPAAYRALVRHGICTEAEATIGISEVTKFRAKLMQNKATN